MTRARLRLLGSLLAAALMTGIAVAGMLSDGDLQRHVGAGLLCSAVPLAALTGWRLTRRAPTKAELGPAPPTGQMLHLGAWTGIATGSVIWLLAAATLAFDAKAGFWALGTVGMLVGYGMAGVVLWSMANPFPPIRVDEAGLTIGNGPPIPWREIETVAYRRAVLGFPHLEVWLTDEEVLRPPVPVTIGVEDLERFFAVAGLRGVPPRAGAPAARRGRAARAGSAG